MQLKRLSFLFIVVVISLSLLIFIQFISAQTAELPEGFGEGDLLDVNKITILSNPQTWQNLSAIWKQKLLENPIVIEINYFFSSVDIVFLVLFGESYSFSLRMFFIAVLWLWFLLQLKRVLGFSLFSQGKIAWLISAGLAIILAQFGLYGAIAGVFVKLISLPKQSWLGILVFAGVVFLLVILGNINRIVEKMVEKNRKASSEQKAEANRGILEGFVGQLKKGFEKK
jgi:hypothetical protein